MKSYVTLVSKDKIHIQFLVRMMHAQERKDESLHLMNTKLKMNQKFENL